MVDNFYINKCCFSLIFQKLCNLQQCIIYHWKGLFSVLLLLFVA